MLETLRRLLKMAAPLHLETDRRLMSDLCGQDPAKRWKSCLLCGFDKNLNDLVNGKALKEKYKETLEEFLCLKLDQKLLPYIAVCESCHLMCSTSLQFRSGALKCYKKQINALHDRSHHFVEHNYASCLDCVKKAAKEKKYSYLQSSLRHDHNYSGVMMGSRWHPFSSNKTAVNQNFEHAFETYSDLTSELSILDLQLRFLSRKDTSLLWHRCPDPLQNDEYFTNAVKEMESSCPVLLRFLSVCLGETINAENKVVAEGLIYGLIMYARNTELQFLHKFYRTSYSALIKCVRLHEEKKKKEEERKQLEKDIKRGIEKQEEQTLRTNKVFERGLQVLRKQDWWEQQKKEAQKGREAGQEERDKIKEVQGESDQEAHREVQETLIKPIVDCIKCEIVETDIQYKGLPKEVSCQTEYTNERDDNLLQLEEFPNQPKESQLVNIEFEEEEVRSQNVEVKVEDEEVIHYLEEIDDLQLKPQRQQEVQIPKEETVIEQNKILRQQSKYEDFYVELNEDWLEEMSVIVNYSDSEESDQGEMQLQNRESPQHKGSDQGKVLQTSESNQHQKLATLKRKLSPNRTEEVLPLPDAIRTLDNRSGKRKHIDSPDSHDGRVRSFEHVEGNWATHIHIPYKAEERILAMIEEMCVCLRPLEFHPMEELHISLSRTVPIRHHWIQSLTDTLLNKFKAFSRTFCELSKVKIYTNDEKTRSFLAVEVISHDSLLPKYVEVVDECFTEYRLEKYYKQPSFHISIAWCLGDISVDVCSKKLDQIQEILENTLNEDTELRIVPVEIIQCKTGNKVFTFPLKRH